MVPAVKVRYFSFQDALCNVHEDRRIPAGFSNERVYGKNEKEDYDNRPGNAKQAIGHKGGH